MMSPQKAILLFLLLPIGQAYAALSTGQMPQDERGKLCDALVGKWEASRWIADSRLLRQGYSTKVKWALQVRPSSDGCLIDLAVETLTETNRLDFVRPDGTTVAENRALPRRPHNPPWTWRDIQRYEGRIKSFDGETADLVKLRRLSTGRSGQSLELPDMKMVLTPDGKLEFPLITPEDWDRFDANVRALGDEATEVLLLKRNKK